MNDETNDANQPVDENKYIALRREKLTQLREQGQAYPNHFRRANFAGDLAVRTRV